MSQTLTTLEVFALGALVYGKTRIRIQLDDRTLRHVQMVLEPKLRRGEACFLSFQEDFGLGHSSVWVSASIPLYFKFDGAQPIPVNRRWLEALTATANRADGLRIVAEPDDSLP